MSGTSSDDGKAWSHAHHLIYYVGMRYRSVVICKDVTHAAIFDIFSCNINAYFQLLFSAVYTLKIDFSVSTLRPCLHVNLQ